MLSKVRRVVNENHLVTTRAFSCLRSRCHSKMIFNPLRMSRNSSSWSDWRLLVTRSATHVFECRLGNPHQRKTHSIKGRSPFFSGTFTEIPSSSYISQNSVGKPFLRTLTLCCSDHAMRLSLGVVPGVVGAAGSCA